MCSMHGAICTLDYVLAVDIKDHWGAWIHPCILYNVMYYTCCGGTDTSARCIKLARAYRCEYLTSSGFYVVCCMFYALHGLLWRRGAVICRMIKYSRASCHACGYVSA